MKSTGIYKWRPQQPAGAYCIAEPGKLYKTTLVGKDGKELYPSREEANKYGKKI